MALIWVVKSVRVSVVKSLDFFNGDALIGSFRLKGIIEADRVVDVALVEHGDFRGQAVFRNVLSGSGTLGRILEADAEGRIVALDGGVGGSRRGQDQNAVVLGGSNNGGVLTGENAAEADIHAVVDQHAVGVDRAFRITNRVLIIEHQGHAVDTAGRVDLINRNLGAVAGRIAVNSIVAGQRAYTADQQFAGASSFFRRGFRFFRGGFRSSAGVSPSSAGSSVSAGSSEEAQALRQSSIMAKARMTQSSFVIFFIS